VVGTVCALQIKKGCTLQHTSRLPSPERVHKQQLFRFVAALWVVVVILVASAVEILVDFKW
jgi:hypothetical protein